MQYSSPLTLQTKQNDTCLLNDTIKPFLIQKLFPRHNFNINFLKEGINYTYNDAVSTCVSVIQRYPGSPTLPVLLLHMLTDPSGNETNSNSKVMHNIMIYIDTNHE